MSDDQVSHWIPDLVAGDPQAAARICDVYFERLVRLAHARLSSIPPQAGDDEGAVVSALRSFFSGVQNRRFPDLNDRNDLWRILATITARKSVAQIRRHWRKRGEGGKMAVAELEQALAPEPDPKAVVALLEECENRLAALNDPTLRRIVMMRLEGYDTQEIADEVGIHRRSVQRKLSLIESQWLDEV